MCIIRSIRTRSVLTQTRRPTSACRSTRPRATVCLPANQNLQYLPATYNRHQQHYQLRTVALGNFRLPDTAVEKNASICGAVKGDTGNPSPPASPPHLHTPNRARLMPAAYSTPSFLFNVAQHIDQIKDLQSAVRWMWPTVMTLMHSARVAYDGSPPKHATARQRVPLLRTLRPAPASFNQSIKQARVTKDFRQNARHPAQRGTSQRTTSKVAKAHKHPPLPTAVIIGQDPLR